MNQKRNNLLISGIIMFAAALVIIVIATISQARHAQSQREFRNEIDRAQVFNQSAQKSISQLMEENESLKLRLSEEQEKLNELSSQAANIDSIQQASEEYREHTNALFGAYNSYNAKRYKESKGLISQVNPDVLDQAGRTLYQNLASALKSRGY